MTLALAPLLGWLDWIVLAGYAVGVLGIGWYFNRRNKDSDDYLVGGRNLGPIRVGLSFFAALFSTITYLSAPGEMVRYGPIILTGIVALPFVLLIAGWWIIPYFMRVRSTSGYELLETRLGPSVRYLGVTFFLMLRLMWMSVIVYATVMKVIIPLTGLDPAIGPWLCLGVTVITVVYSTMGGLQAIVTIDAFQVLLLFGGVVLALGLITGQLGGVGAWWPDAWQANWTPPSLIDGGESGRSIIGAFMAVLIWTVATAGADQVAIQRYLATRDVRAARQMLGVSLLSIACIQLLLGCLGLALLAYATSHPEWLPDGQTIEQSADSLFPRFIATMLPAGIAGLIVAGMLAEAMNSLSSGVSSVSCVVSSDLVGRLRAGPHGDPTAHPLSLAATRWISVGIGAVILVLSMVMQHVQGNLTELAYKVVNLLTVPLFGLFFMALFVRWARPLGTYVGAIVSFIVIAVINFWSEIPFWREITGQPAAPLSFLWAMPLGLVVQIIVGVTFSFIPVGMTVEQRLRLRGEQDADSEQTDSASLTMPT